MKSDTALAIPAVPGMSPLTHLTRTVYLLFIVSCTLRISTVLPRIIAPQSSEYNIFPTYWNNALYRNSASIQLLID